MRNDYGKGKARKKLGTKSRVFATNADLICVLPPVHAHIHRDLSICLIGRWDMDGENSVLVEKVLPQLKQVADDLYCKINIVNLEVSLTWSP